MWLYNGKIFSEDDISDYVGFVYQITDVETDKKYIGQKKFYNDITRKPLKGKTRKRHSKKMSDWEEYYGSNDILQNDVALNGKSRYKREIIHLCKGKAEMNYRETQEIFLRDAILKECYYNSWVSCKINRNQLGKMVI